MQKERDSEGYNIPGNLDFPVKKTIWTQIWSWGVVGSIVLGVFSAGIGIMTSGHPWVADGFFGACTALFLLKFWTWEEARAQPWRTKWLLLIAAPSLCLAIVVPTLLWNHVINRAAPAGRSAQPPMSGTEVPGNGTTHVDGKVVLPERKGGEQTGPLVATPNPLQKAAPTSGRNISKAAPQSRLQLQQITLVLRNDTATPQFYVNNHASLPMSYSSGIATLQLPTGSYLVRAEYPNWTCSAFVTLPIEKQRPVPANCKLR
jgi:hypothetical protein